MSPNQIRPPEGVPQIRESITFVPVRVETRFGEIGLSTGTAFFLNRKGRSFLITNWHIVSGRSPIDGQPLCKKTTAIPDHIIIRVPTNEPRKGGAFLRTYVDRQLPLYNEKKSPIWFEHPTEGYKCDVIAIPLSGLDETAIVGADHDRHGLEELPLYPSLDVYVVGFPRGMGGRAATPIWKRGTIATEPDLDHDKQPKFLIDTATREGMSGSPVYAQEVGTWLPPGGSDREQRSFGKGRMFVGVYSGRIGAEDEFKAQLGIVWKRSAIESVIEAEKFGKSSFDFFSQSNDER